MLPGIVLNEDNGLSELPLRLVTETQVTPTSVLALSRSVMTPGKLPGNFKPGLPLQPGRDADFN